VDKRILKIRAPAELVRLLDRVAYYKMIPRGRLIVAALADSFRDYFGESGSLALFSINRDKVNLTDQLLGELIPVRLLGAGEMFCMFCKSFSCSHVRYAKRYLAKARESKIFSSPTTFDHQNGE